MKVKNGLVYQNEQEEFIQTDIYIKDGKFTDTPFEEPEIIDAEGCYIIPGLIDLHFHGCDGYDFCDGTSQALDAITAYQARNGITSIAPASMTLDDKSLEKIFENASKLKGVFRKGHAEIIGINMEGPYISIGKKGAQNEKYIRKPDIAHFRHMNQVSDGLIKLTALAPEVEGAFEFIDALKEEVRISAAHTEAGYETASESFRRGMRQVTHLFNAMYPFTHRETGVVGAAFDHPDVSVELICDGIHIVPSMIRAVFQLFGASRVILISDSMMAAGLSDGMYALGGQDVIVKGNKAVLSDGTIAGSVTNLMNCTKYALSCGIPFEKLINCVTKNPAEALGVYERVGSIKAGKYADFVVMDQDKQVKAVYMRGSLI